MAIFLAGTLIYIILAAFLILSFRIKGWKEQINILSLGILGAILSRGMATPLIRFFFETDRPFVALGINPLLDASPTSSFPSGHIAFIVPIAMAIWYINKRIGIWSLVGALAIGVSRVFSGVHWPIDILGGFVVGAIAFFIVQVLVKKIPRKAFADEKGGGEPADIGK